MTLHAPMHFMGVEPAALSRFAVSGTQCIVLGDCPEKVEQYDEALERMPYAHLMCVNNAAHGVDCVPQLIATLHGGKKDFIGTDRMPIELMHDALLICEDKCGWEHERVDMIMHGYPTGGTSALFGVLAAVWLGYEQILMAGCPLTHYQYGTSSTLSNWAEWAPYLCGRVDALGGNVKRILDAARAGECISIEWLLKNYSTGHAEPSAL